MRATEGKARQRREQSLIERATRSELATQTRGWVVLEPSSEAAARSGPDVPAVVVDVHDGDLVHAELVDSTLAARRVACVFAEKASEQCQISFLLRGRLRGGMRRWKVLPKQ